MNNSTSKNKNNFLYYHRESFNNYQIKEKCFGKLLNQSNESSLKIIAECSPNPFKIPFTSNIISRE